MQGVGQGWHARVGALEKVREMKDLVEATLKKPAIGTLRIYEDCEALAHAATELICETAVLKPGPARLALCGGNAAAGLQAARERSPAPPPALEPGALDHRG